MSDHLNLKQPEDKISYVLSPRQLLISLLDCGSASGEYGDGLPIGVVGKSVWVKLGGHLVAKESGRSRRIT
jgi:hypothetical protein